MVGTAELRRRAGMAGKGLLRRSPAVWHLAGQTRARINRFRGPRHFAGVDGEFHPNDFMLRSSGGLRRDSIDAYLQAGHVDAELLIELVLSAMAVNIEKLGWVEVGAGYGRVIRALSERVPHDQITAVDRVEEAVQFCREQFGVAGALSTEYFELDDPVRGDAVFAISVATHLPWNVFERFLGLLDNTVEPGGVVIFTTHGQLSLATLERYDQGRYSSDRAELTRQYDTTGFAYVAYGNEREGSYGMAWHSPQFVVATVKRVTSGRWDLVEHRPHGLAEHQDIWVYRSRPA